MNESGEQGTSGEKKTKRHRRGTRGGQKARTTRGTASSRSSSTSDAGTGGKSKTTRTRKPRTSKTKTAPTTTDTIAESQAETRPSKPASVTELPAQNIRTPQIKEPSVEKPSEVAPVTAEPQSVAAPVVTERQPHVSAPPERSGSDAIAPPAINTPIRPLGGYRATVNRGGTSRMSFGGRGGGRQHFRPSGFTRPAVPPVVPEASSAASQQASEEIVKEDVTLPTPPAQPEAATNEITSDVASQQVPNGPQDTAPAENGEGAEGPEPGNELHPPAGRQQNFGGRQQSGFRGPNRVDRNQGHYGKFPQQQQRGGQRNQKNFNQQGNNRNNQQRQNWNQQRGGLRNQGQNPQNTQRGPAFNGNRQNNGQGGQARFERGPRQPHQQGTYQQPGYQPQFPTQPQEELPSQALPVSNVAPSLPIPQPRPQVESIANGEAELETRQLNAPVAPSPAVNESVTPNVAENTEAAISSPANSGEPVGNGVDHGALAPFAEDIEIDETPVVHEKRREPTGRDMIINVVEGEEVRIAIVRKGMLEEFYMERASNESHVGNIYKGRVTNVEPSIQAAFIDFGLGKNGFLHISDLHPMYFGPQYRAKFQRVMEKRDAERKRQQQQRAASVAQTAVNSDEPTQEVVTPPPGAPETHISADATSAPVVEANESAMLNATPHETDIDAELNAEAPPEVLFDSDSDEAVTEENNAVAEPPQATPTTDEAVNPSASSEGDEKISLAAATGDVAASFPGTEPTSTVENVEATSEESSVNGDASAASPAETSIEEEDDDDLSEFDIDDGGIAPMERVGKKTPRRDRPPIQQCLRRGQEVIVQVTKEGIGTKGPTLTTYVSIPGRALVMMPGMSALGVSRKIEDEQQRRNLRRLLSDLNPPKNLGFIIRTAGAELSKHDLQGDLNYLVRMWNVIAQRIRNNKAPIELYQESDLVIRTMRDGFTGDIDRIIVDNEQVASRIRDFLSIVDPRSAGAVEFYTGTLPIFQRYNIERQIENIHSRRVELPNGGSLVIDSAEALVAIDVNSGRYREQRDAEMTAFNMNKEAVKEIVRQLRLRDLGGVIVMDFIDMREERHKREIEHMLREHMKHDRAKAKVLRMSQFCMIEMTRQRVRPSIKRSIYMDCPHCRGTALIKTPESVSLDVMRRLAAGATRADVHRLEVRLYPTVANYILNRKRKTLVELEEKSGKRINISADPMIAGDAVQIDAYNGRDDRINLQL